MKATTIPWIIGGAAALAIAATTFYPKHGGVHPVTPSEENAAAESALDAKLSGPGYFRVTSAIQQEGGGLWIEVDDAMSQVHRIVVARKLGPDGSRKLEMLIEQTAEPHPYRVVGGKRIDLVRLNLSLDALGK